MIITVLDAEGIGCGEERGGEKMSTAVTSEREVKVGSRGIGFPVESSYSSESSHYSDSSQFFRLIY